MFKPLKAPRIAAKFPIKLQETKTPKNLFQKIKYRFFVTPFTYVFIEDYTIKVNEFYSLTITKGFKTDLSSVPPFLWKLLPPLREESGDAALVHDWLYTKDIYRGLMGWFLNKIWCDWIMLQLEKESPKYDYLSRFFGVLIFGWGVYFRRSKESKIK